MNINDLYLHQYQGTGFTEMPMPLSNSALTNLISIARTTDIKSYTDTNINSSITYSYQSASALTFSASTIETTFAYVNNGEPNGFPNTTDSVIQYNPSTNIFTLSSSTATPFTYFNNGHKYTLLTTGVTLNGINNFYYIYFNSANTFTVQNTIWAFQGNTLAAYIFYNASGNTTFSSTGQASYSPDGFMIEERHGTSMDWNTHERLHLNPGCVVTAGFALQDYTTNPGTPTLLTNVWTINSGNIMDEDLFFTLPTVSANTSNYTMFYRNGINSYDWRWVKNQQLPYIWSGAGYICYNQLNGSSYKLTPLTTGQYTNYYIFAVPAVNTGFSYVVVPGQNVYSSLATAQAESVLSLNWGSVPFTEIAPLYQLTYQAKSTFTNVSGLTNLAANPVKLIGTNISLSSNYQAPIYSLAGASDVSISSPSSGQQLVYNGTAWANQDLSKNYLSANTSGNWLSANTSYYTQAQSNTNFLSANTTKNWLSANTSSNFVSAITQAYGVLWAPASFNTTIGASGQMVMTGISSLTGNLVSPNSATTQLKITNGGYYRIGMNGYWYSSSTNSFALQIYSGSTSLQNIQMSFTNNTTNVGYQSSTESIAKVDSGTVLSIYASSAGNINGTFYSFNFFAHRIY